MVRRETAKSARSVVSLMTDADLVAHHPGGARKLWNERFVDTVLVRSLASMQCVKLQIVAANSERLATPCGTGWLAVGDAAISWDPLSSQGILTALESGIRGATATLDASSHSLDEYAHWLELLWKRYLQHYRYYYDQVRRWSHSEFWRRRQLTESAAG